MPAAVREDPKVDDFPGERRGLSGECINSWGNAEDFWGNAEISDGTHRTFGGTQKFVGERIGLSGERRNMLKVATSGTSTVVAVR